MGIALHNRSVVAGKTRGRVAYRCVQASRQRPVIAKQIRTLGAPTHYFIPRATFHKDGFLPPDAVSASVCGNWAICASAWVALFSSIAKRARATA
jgi:hypothetical protein